MVSIIIPVYNVAPYIEDCLKSVMGQTYDGEMECLIIDDCGTDESIAIIMRLIAGYSGPIRFEIIHHEHNRGLSAARNTGIANARGEYLYFLDSDDWITADCIAILMGKVLEYPLIELVQGNTRTEPMENPDSHTLTISMQHAKNNDEVRACLFHLGQFSVHSWNKLIRKAFVIEHELLFREGVLHEDILWRFYLQKYLKGACFISNITYVYRLRSNSIIRGTDKQTSAKNRSIVYREILSNLTVGHEKEEFHYYAKEFAMTYLLYGYVYSGMKEVFWRYWKKGRELGVLSIEVQMAFYYVLGHSRHGRLVLFLLDRLKSPILLKKDIWRIGGSLRRRIFKKLNKEI